MEKRLQAILGSDRCTLHVEVNEAQWLGRRASLSIVQRVSTQLRGGQQDTLQWSAGTLELARTQTVHAQALARAYQYKGELISIEWLLRVKIDDGVLFDSRIEVPIGLPDPARRTAMVGKAAKELYQPTDRHTLRARFQGLVPADRPKLVLTAVATVALIAAQLVLGWHDAAVPEAETLFYDHTWTATATPDAGLPITKALLGSALVAILSWVWMVLRFARYVRCQLKIRKLPSRNVRLAPAQLIGGRARVPLEGVEVRVVVANVEHGVARPRLGPFRTEEQAGRAICLFRQTLARVPANTPIENYLHGDIDFAPLYETLYPPAHIGGMGVLLKWRIQLVHPQFTDRHADGIVDQLKVDDFLSAATATA